MEELEKNETSTQAEENTVSLASAQALADALAKIEAYTPTTWVDNSSPDIDAEHLNKPEQAIKRVTDALNSAVDVIKDLQSQVTKNAGAISDVNNNLSNYANATMHRMIFRGKYLGDKFTDAQKAAIKNGTFDDLFLGDYWNIKGRTWRIVDMDYWYNCGDTAFTSHHLVIMPDEALYNAQMNTTNVTTGGYVGSEMYKKNLENAKTIVNAAFQGSVLTHREYLCNAVANGRPSGGAWFDSSIELPNEPMMYGHLHFSPTSDGSTVPSIYTISKTQLALFMVCPRFIVNRSYNQWLRDVVSSAYFALVYGYGYAAYYNAAGSFGVRPVFPVG